MAIEEIAVLVIVVHLIFGLVGIEVRKLERDRPTQQQTDEGGWLNPIDIP